MVSSRSSISGTFPAVYTELSQGVYFFSRSDNQGIHSRISYLSEQSGQVTHSCLFTFLCLVYIFIG